MRATMPVAMPARPTAVSTGTKSSALRFGLARVLEGGVLASVVASVMFVFTRVVPGDPARVILGDFATEASLAALRHRLGLEGPRYVQYAHFMRHTLSLDFGESTRRPGVSALSLAVDAAGPSAQLAACAVVFAAVLGLGAAILAVGPWLGARARFVERAARGIASVPLLSFAPLLTFALALRVRVIPLPGDPEAGVVALLYPAVLLGLPMGAHLARMSIASLSAISRMPFLLAARARGQGPLRTWLVHGVPASSAVLLTVLMAQFGALVGGAVVVERLFQRRGLGTLVLEAYASRDLPVMEAALFLGSLLFIATQTVGRVALVLTDPRARSPS